MEEEKQLDTEELATLLEPRLRQNKLDVACIETFKVYDFCFQSERVENQCFNLGNNTIPPGCKINCEIKDVDCKEIERSKPDRHGKADVCLAIKVKAKVKIKDPKGNVVFRDVQTFGFTKTVVLCAPKGTEIYCNVVNAACGPCAIMGNQVCCTFDLCIVIHSAALVKLLVPSFGFCTPTPCEQVAPGPPFVCPPALFPPSCPRSR